MIEKIVKGSNLQKASRQTIANKGSSGVDALEVGELKLHLASHKTKLLTAILNHTYVPQAIRGVTIPKANGKTRLLGIPTVLDRMLQQAVSQVLMPVFE